MAFIVSQNEDTRFFWCSSAFSAWARSARAYRPFDGTDASVASTG